MLAASDFVALLLAGALAFLLWARPVHGQPVSLYLPAAPAALLVVLGYGLARLYPGFGLGPVEVLRRHSLVTATAILGLASLVFALKLENIYSRVTLALAFGLALLLVPVLRGVVVRVGRRRPWWPEPVVLVGTGDGIERIRHVLRDRSPEFRPVGAINCLRAAHADGDGVVEAATRFTAGGVDLALAEPGVAADAAVMDRIRSVFPRVIVLRELRELPVEGVQIRNLGGLLGLEYGNNLLDRRSRWVKRSMDVAVAAVTLVLTLPIIAAAMLAVKVLSPGPALFWQEREGWKGRTIRVPKIRTMIPDAERHMEELLRSDPALRAEWESAFKLKYDPRVIRYVGRFFRRYSIDELPQLWSVIRGDMSLVGPRPFPDYHLDVLAPHVRRLRDAVRPGITGLWQVTSRGEAGVEAQQSFDTYYIRNWSVWLDLHVLTRTIGVVLSGRGAY